MRYLIPLILVTLASCTQPDRASSALESAGYTDIVIDGFGWFDCSEDDTFATRFRAVGPSGVPVSGTVCAGWFKGATIRLD